MAERRDSQVKPGEFLPDWASWRFSSPCRSEEKTKTNPDF
jgi:hypothetical protein